VPEKSRGESPLRTSLAAIADAVEVGLLCLLGCAFVVTAVPSIAAAFGVVERRRFEPGTPILPEFVAGFRRHVRRGVTIGLLGLAVSAVVAVDLIYVLAHPVGLQRSVVLALAILLALVLLFAAVWVPALLQYPGPGVAAVLRAAVIFGFGKPGATVLCLLVLFVAAVVGLTLLPLAPLCVYAALRAVEWQTQARVRAAQVPAASSSR
jgi:uncharacterized membrane protein YesL